MTLVDGSVTQLMSRAQILSIVDSAKRKIALWVGSVSGGKTVSSLFAFLEALRHAPRTGEIIISGATLPSIETNVIAVLQRPDLFGRLAAQTIHTVGANYALILGRRVRLVGASTVRSEERIRGATVALAYVDEATIIPETYWDMLVTRLRVAGARLLATTNPGSMNHWLRKKWILRADAVDMAVFRLTMYDNPSLTPDYIASMEKTYTGAFYKRFILGEWSTAEGAVYPDWNPEVGGGHVIEWADMPPIQRVLAVGLDHGITNPTVALLLGITAETMPGSFDRTPRLVLMDEWVDEPAMHQGRAPAPSEQAAEFRHWYHETPHMPSTVMSIDRAQPYVIVDPAAKAFREQLARPVGRYTLGLPSTPADNDVLAGIGDVGMLIKNELLVATTRCERWLSEVTEYRWDAKAAKEGKDEVVKENDHAMDAGRYDVRTTRGLWLNPIRQAYDIAA